MVEPISTRRRLGYVSNYIEAARNTEDKAKKARCYVNAINLLWAEMQSNNLLDDTGKILETLNKDKCLDCNMYKGV